MDCWHAAHEYIPKRVARDGLRYPIEEWRAWYGGDEARGLPVEAVNEMFACAPDYLSMLDCVNGEDLYAVNVCGETLNDRHSSPRWRAILEIMGPLMVGVAFAGCLVVFPTEYASRFAYMDAVDVPRTRLIRTRAGTTIYDLRKDVHYFLQVQRNPAWLAIDFETIQEECFRVLRGRADPSPRSAPFFDFLQLRTGVLPAETKQS